MSCHQTIDSLYVHLLLSEEFLWQFPRQRALKFRLFLDGEKGICLHKGRRRLKGLSKVLPCSGLGLLPVYHHHFWPWPYNLPLQVWLLFEKTTVICWWQQKSKREGKVLASAAFCKQTLSLVYVSREGKNATTSVLWLFHVTNDSKKRHRAHLPQCLGKAANPSPPD